MYVKYMHYLIYSCTCRAKNEIKRLDKIYADKTANFKELLDVCVSYIAASKVRNLPAVF